MKNILFTLVLWLFTFTTSAQQSWQVVGQPGFSEPYPYLFPQSLTLDNNGIPYVAYAKVELNEVGEVVTRGVVKKNENNTWLTVGDYFYISSTDSSGFIYASIIFNSNNILYVAYTDQSNLAKVTVKKLENGSWQQVGTTISESYSGYSSIALDNNDITYVSYKDGGNSGKVTVKKFENNSWQVVGDAGFSTGDEVNDYIPLAFDSNNVPYVAFADYIQEQNNEIIRVMKFENGDWGAIPTEEFYTKWISRISLAISSNNTIYIAYKNIDNASEIPFSEFIVKKFENNNWQNILEQELIFAYPGDIRLTLFDNVPYIALTDIENDNKATVKKFENGNLQIVGEAGFTESTMYVGSFDISYNGVPYLALIENANDQKITVMKYDNTMSIDTHTHTVLSYSIPILPMML